MKKIYFILKICFFFIAFSTSIYLKKNDFLSSIDSTDLMDKTDFIIVFNEFSNLLIVVALLMIGIFFTYFKMSKHLTYVTILDRVILSYFILYFIILLTTKFSHYEFYDNMAYLSISLSSLTFLQVNFFGVLPNGIILYIPIIYLFFIQKNKRRFI